jgi:hypothetical protein
MWYNDAEDYISYGLLGAAVFFVWSLALAHVGQPDNAVRTISLVGLAFGTGLYLGIASTAKGSFYLPLGVMQKQMHEMWEIPLTNLRPGSGRRMISTIHTCSSGCPPALRNVQAPVRR